MAVFTLESLVLRGVSVLADGQNVGLRLGAESKKAGGQTTEIRVIPPTPSRRTVDMQSTTRLDHADYPRVEEPAYGAGRPLSGGVGSPSRRSPARIAGWPIPLGWSKPCGAPNRNAAASARPLPSNASSVFARGSFTRTGKAAKRSVVLPARCKPARGTRSAPTWGA